MGRGIGGEGGVEVAEHAPPAQNASRDRYPPLVSTGELAPPTHGASMDRFPAGAPSGLPMPSGNMGALKPDTVIMLDCFLR